MKATIDGGANACLDQTGQVAHLNSLQVVHLNVRFECKLKSTSRRRRSVLALQTGSYRERPVALPLKRHFACVRMNRVPKSLSAPVVVVPDGTIDLQWIRGRWRIAGPDRLAQKEKLRAGSVVIGFRFQPGSAAEWLGTAASEFCDKRVWLADVWGAAGRRADAESESFGPEPLVADLENILGRWAPFMRLPHSDMHTAQHLLESGPPVDVDVVPWITRALGLTERTLRRRFDAAFGYGPKTLERILRFQRYVQILRSPTWTSAAHRAAAAGYADQSHLVRECRRLALCTPSQLPSRLPPCPFNFLLAAGADVT
jgi:AraC-like DNA-binding protein